MILQSIILTQYRDVTDGQTDTHRSKLLCARHSDAMLLRVKIRGANFAAPPSGRIFIRCHRTWKHLATC